MSTEQQYRTLTTSGPAAAKLIITGADETEGRKSRDAQGERDWSCNSVASIELPLYLLVTDDVVASVM